MIIRECNEKLVNIKKICPQLIVDLGKNSIKDAYLRETVALMVVKAKSYLPKDMTFIIRDAWRSQVEQKRIYANFIDMFYKKHPDWPYTQIIKEVNKYVAAYEGKFVSGHMTGGAVDLRLIYKGKKLPMRSRKLTYQQNAKSRQPLLPRYIQRNRNIMFSALNKAGLSNYPKEFWHWSYGDIWWAKRNKKNAAIYGIITRLD